MKNENLISIDDVKSQVGLLKPKLNFSLPDYSIEKAPEEGPEVLSFFELTTKEIRSCIQNIRQNFFLLGAKLSDIKSSDEIKTIFNWKLGRECKNIYEYAEQEFRICKSTVINLIGIVERFGKTKSCLAKKWENYTYSQLTEMLPLADKQLELVSTDMSMREIRALRKVNMKKVDQAPGQISDQPSNDPENPLGFVLKNDSQRLDFLKAYKNWKLFATVPELQLKFYRCDLSNGDFLLATESTYFLSEKSQNCEYYMNHLESVNYRIIHQGTSSNNFGYSLYEDSTSEILSYFKQTKALVLLDPARVLEAKG